VTRTILRRLRSLEEAQRLYSGANEGTGYKELLIAKLESMAQACRHEPTWREPTSEEDLEGSRRLSELFTARGWHGPALAVLGAASEAP
jgi:hypothetical protein